MRRYPSRRQSLALILITLLGFALRLNCLRCQSLWLDESASVYWTTISFVAMIFDTADNLHTPGYYGLLSVWTALAGISEFSVRYFSVWSGLLLIPLLYWYGAEIWGDRRTGYLAALLAAVSPAHVAYSQETRLYALMPVVYVMLLALALQKGDMRRRRTWFLLALIESIALYLHPFSLFMIAVLNVIFIGRLIHHEKPVPWTTWFLSQLIVGLIFAPWLWLVWRHGGNIPANLVDTTTGEIVVRFDAYLRQIAYFLQTSLTEPVAVAMATSIAALAVVPLALPLIWRRETKHTQLIVLIVAFALPLLAGYPVWRFNPLTHPRYLIFVLAPLLLLLARTLSLLAARRMTLVLCLAGLGILLVSDAIALRLIFGDPRFSRFNMRQLAETVSRRAAPGKAVLMPPLDHALRYYDPAPATLVNWPFAKGNQDVRAVEMGHLLESYSGAFLVQYQTLYSYDPHQQVPFLMELNGQLRERFVVDRMNVDDYDLNGKWIIPTFAERDMKCGPLTLSGIFYETTATPARATVAALRWRLDENVDEPIVISTRLLDDEQQIAADDVLLLDEAGTPTGEWRPATEAISYHILPVPLGSAPLTYTLRAVPYTEGAGVLCKPNGGGGLQLETVQGISNRAQSTDPYGSWADTSWLEPTQTTVAPGLTLEGFTMRPTALRPNDVIYVTLRWRAGSDLSETYSPVLLLRQENRTLAEVESTLFTRYPTSRWREGELLIETRTLTVPATLSPLELVLEQDGNLVPIGTTGIDRDALLWELPEGASPTCARLGDIAELVGYKWEPKGASPGQGKLTLYWQALPGGATSPSYTVYTHLLNAAGELVGQHDSPPAAGRRPTTTWLPGEIIADVHELSPEANGAFQLTTGMYDLSTNERLPAFNCDGQRYDNDAIPVTTVDTSKSR